MAAAVEVARARRPGDVDERRVVREDNVEMVEYLIEWKGWPAEMASWEPESSLDDCPLVLRAWTARLAARESRRRATAERAAKRERERAEALAADKAAAKLQAVAELSALEALGAAVAATAVETQDRMREYVPFVHWHGVRCVCTSVQHYTAGATSSVK